MLNGDFWFLYFLEHLHHLAIERDVADGDFISNSGILCLKVVIDQRVLTPLSKMPRWPSLGTREKSRSVKADNPRTRNKHGKWYIYRKGPPHHLDW